MTLTNPTSPFFTDETRVLESQVLRADAAHSIAEGWLKRHAEALAARDDAEATFVATLREDDLNNLAVQSNSLRVYETGANAIENGGGPNGARDRILRTYKNFSLLEKAFGSRAAEIGKLIQPLRERLAARRGELTKQGVHFLHIEKDLQVYALNVEIAGIEAAQSGAVNDERYCRQWKPEKIDRSFDSLLDCVVMPLPTITSVPAA